MAVRNFDGWYAPLTDAEWRAALSSCPAPFPTSVRSSDDSRQAPEYFWLIEPDEDAAEIPADQPGVRMPRGMGVFYYPYKTSEAIFHAWLEHQRPAPWWRARLEGDHVGGGLTLIDRDGQERVTLPVRRMRALASSRAALGFAPAPPERFPEGSTVDVVVVPRSTAAGLSVLRDLLRLQTTGRPLVRDIKVVHVHVADGSGGWRRTNGLRFTASSHDMSLLVRNATQGAWNPLAERLIEGAPMSEAVGLFRVCRATGVDPVLPLEMERDDRDGAQAEGDTELCLCEWGATPSGARWDRSAQPSPPESLPDAVPVWRAFSSVPMAWVELDSAQPLVKPRALLVPWVRLGDTPGVRDRSSTERLVATPKFEVPFRLVDAAQPAEPKAWLLHDDDLETMRAVLGIQPASRLDGLEIAAVPAINGWLLQRRHGERFFDVSGEPMTPLPGCPRALVPTWATLRPRLNPVRLPGLLDLPPDGVTLFVPSERVAAGTNGNRNGSNRSGGGVPFDRVTVARTAFQPLSSLVEYTLQLELSHRLPLAVPQLLDDSVFEHPRHWAALAHRAFLDLRQAGKAAAPRQQPSEAQRPVSRPTVEPLPESAPAEPTTQPRRRNRPTARIVRAPAPVAEPDQLVAEERRLEDKVAEHLSDPSSVELRSLWFELGRVKRAREKLGEALFCLVNSRWFLHGPEAGPPIDRADYREELAFLAATTSLAEGLTEVDLPDALARLERSDTWTAEHFIWLLYLVESVAAEAADGNTPAPELTIGLQRFLGRLRPVLPYKLRWLVALEVARLAADDIALEREREDLLGELNLRGLTVQNLESLVSALLARRGGRMPQATASSAGVASTRWASDDTAAPTEKWARAWPNDALREWTTVLGQITSPGERQRGHNSANRYCIALGEMLLTVSRRWGQKNLPLESLQDQIQHARSSFFAAPVLLHLAEFEADRTVTDEERLDALRRFVTGDTEDDRREHAKLFENLSPELKERVSRYMALLGHRWASPAVRVFWRDALSQRDLDAIVGLIGQAPRHWLALLGYEFITHDLLPRVETEAEQKRLKLQTSARAALVVVMNEMASVLIQRNLEPLLTDDLPLPPQIADDAIARLQEAFEKLADKMAWEREIEKLGDPLARLEFLDAPALDFQWKDPTGPADWRWLQTFARLVIANAARFCRRGERQTALEQLEQLVEAWRTTYPHHDRLTAAARGHVKWLVRGVIDVLPLVGNRTAGTRLINTCIEHARSGDPYTQAEMYTAAARALALLGERDEAESILTRIVQAADENLHDDDLLMFEVLEQAITSGMELLEPNVFRARLARPVRGMISRHFQGPAGVFYRKQAALHVNFAEWSLEADPEVLPRLKGKKKDRRGDADDDRAGLDEAGVRDHALYWARQYLQSRAYEKDETIAGWFKSVQDYIGRNKDSFSALARDQLQALTDHFLGEAAAEHKALHDFRKMEETWIRNRVAWEQL